MNEASKGNIGDYDIDMINCKDNLGNYLKRLPAFDVWYIYINHFVIRKT
jgi:hypothetical protein